MSDIIGVVIGGALALAGGFLTKFYETVQERRTLVQALSGEISAVLDMLQEVEQQKITFEVFKVTNQPSPSQAATVRSYFLVYENNASKIGYLKPEAAQEVARFYIHAKFFVDELLDYRHSPHTIEQGEEQIRNLQLLARKVRAIGRQAISSLGIEGPRRKSQ